MSGIKETSEILRFVGAFISTTAEVTEDGKVSIFEITRYLSLWPIIAPAVENFKAAGAELADIDASERTELRRVFSDALRLPNPITEELFAEGSDLALHVLQFVAKVRAAKKESVVVTNNG